MVKTILIVEGDVIVRNSLVKMLVSEEFHVLETACAEEALVMACQWDGVIDLIIANISESAMRPRQLWESLQQLRPNLKVLQISGYAFTRFAGEGRNVPDAAFLRKPFSRKALLKIVRKILGPTDLLTHSVSAT